MPMKIYDTIFEKREISVGKYQVQAAICKTLKWIEAKVKDQLLMELGRHTGNRIYHVDCGVMRVENTYNWVWFVKKLKAYLDVGDGEEHIIVSTRQKVLMKPFIWDLSWNYNETEDDERLKELRKFDYEVYADVMKGEPMSWCRAFYKIGPYYEEVENNSTKSFNNYVVKARDKPFVPVLETIKRLAMVCMSKRNDGNKKT